MRVTETGPVEPTARRKKPWLFVTIIVVASGLLLISPIRSWYRNHPHGNPDPGGKRLAALTRVAREALPAGATSTHLLIKKSTWGHGGCDGGPPGWTNIETDQTFRASGGVAAQVDMKMRMLHWHVVSKVRAPAGVFPPPTLPGPNAPWARQYEPSADPGAPVAWLYTPAQAGGSFWELDLVVAPAEVPDHAC